MLPGKMSHEKLIGILRQRLQLEGEEVFSELLTMDGIDEVLERADVQELETTKKKLTRMEASRAEVKDSFMKFARQGGGKATSGSSASSSFGLVGFGGRSYGKQFPQEISDTMEADDLVNWLPPGVRVTKEYYHHRWRLYWKEPSQRTRSAAWQLYGFAGAAVKLAKEAWQEWEGQGGQPCPFSWGRV